METNHIRTIEIEGVKFEIDTRTAKKIELFKVGDRVKVLVKDYSGYKAHPGCIVGIDAFKNLPTVVVAYMPNPLSSDGKIEFAYLNGQSKDLEICPMVEDELVPTRETIVQAFERAISIKQREIADVMVKRDWFLRQYGTAFGVAAAEMKAAT